MHINLPTYVSAFFSTPAQNAYVKVANVSMNFVTNQARVIFNVYEQPTDYPAKRPIGEFEMVLGEKYGNVTLPTLFEAVASQPQAFDVFREFLYETGVTLPAAVGGTVVP